jgi:hypothetical protein
MARNDDTGRTVALVGGGAALLWLLLHGGGGFGLGRGGSTIGASGKADKLAKVTPVKVRLASDGVTVDGQATDIPGAAALVKARGAADVVITGAAKQGTADELVKALRATGATVWIQGGYGHA